jgi:membrane-associated protease RseP (regulator of RpoE activity)
VSELATTPPARQERPAWARADGRPPQSPRSTRRSLVELALVVLVVVAAAIATGTTDVLVVIVALIVMIMLHELGHFATAKWSHMKVTEYFLGFGPRLWSVHRGETEYGIKAIPAGGYVKIVGMSNLEEVDPADEPRTYRQQPFRKRLLVAVAGSAMHALMALVLIYALLVAVGLPQGSQVHVTGFAPLSDGTDPAKAAGLHVGDVIVRADGRRITSSDTLARVIGDHAGQPLVLVVHRGTTTRTVVVTPVAGALSGTTGPATAGHIGVNLETPPVGGHVERVSPAAGISQSFTGFGRVVTTSVSALGQTFSASGLSQYWQDLTNPQAAKRSENSATRIQSIYGAVRTGVQGAESGMAGLFEVLISINIFIGMLNLLPMLPLDGGHVAVAVYERIRSRRGRMYHADVRKLAPVAYAFVLFLGFIVVSALYLDITHPVANPFH